MKRKKQKITKPLFHTILTLLGICVLVYGHFVYTSIKSCSSSGIKLDIDIKDEEDSSTTHTTIKQITPSINKNEEFKFQVEIDSNHYTIVSFKIKVGDKELVEGEDYEVDYETRIVTIKPNRITQNISIQVVEKGLSTKVMINGLDYIPIGTTMHYEGVVLGGDDEKPIKTTGTTWELVEAPEGVTLSEYTGELYVPSGIDPDQTIKIKAIANDLNATESEIKIIKTKAIGDYKAIGVIAWENTKMTLVNNGDNNPDLQYSTDFETWKKVEAGTAIEIKKGSTILLKGNNPDGFSKSDSDYSTIHFLTDQSGTTERGVELVGNVMSLIDDGLGTTTTIPCDYCFNWLFAIAKVEPYAGGDKKTLRNEIRYVPLNFLPATTLTTGCYQNMFNSTRLVYAPLLPATTVTDKCYRQMFYDDYKMKSAAPLYHVTNNVLPAQCYQSMYCWCDGLNLVEGTSYPYAYYILTGPYTEQLGTDSVDSMFSDTKISTKLTNGAPTPGKAYAFIL